MTPWQAVWAGGGREAARARLQITVTTGVDRPPDSAIEAAPVPAPESPAVTPTPASPQSPPPPATPRPKPRPAAAPPVPAQQFWSPPPRWAPWPSRWGNCIGRLQEELGRAAQRVSPHLARDEHKMMVMPPDLDEVLKLVVSNACGPAVDPRSTLRLRASERAGTSVAAMVEHRAKRVLGFHPAERKDAGHG